MTSRLCIELRVAKRKATKLYEINWFLKHINHFYDSDEKSAILKCCSSDISSEEFIHCSSSPCHVVVVIISCKQLFIATHDVD